MKKVMIALLTMFVSHLAFAGSVKMCEQNAAEDPNAYSQFLLDLEEEAIIFHTSTGGIAVCDYDEMDINAEFTHQCALEVDRGDGPREMVLNISFEGEEIVKVKELLFNGPHTCRD